MRATFATLFLALVSWPAAPAGQTPSSPCAVRTDDRVIAVGDIHGAHDRFVRLLRTAGLLDMSDRWTGGRTILVQTGDVVDRGPDSRKTLDLLRRLEGEAKRAGGDVLALIGNHEAMRMMHVTVDASAAEYAAFRSPSASALRDRYFQAALQTAPARAAAAGKAFDEDDYRAEFMAAVPLGLVEMQIAFEPGGEYGDWLRGHATMAIVNDVAFIHGGTTPAIAALGCAGINAGVRAELIKGLAVDDPERPDSLIAGANGPLWYRGLSDDASPAPDEEVGRVLALLGVQTMVVAHTVAPTLRVTPAFDNRVVRIDTGMLGGTFYPGGRASALEIHRGTFTAIYEDRRDFLFKK